MQMSIRVCSTSLIKMQQLEGSGQVCFWAYITVFSWDGNSGHGADVERVGRSVKDLIGSKGAKLGMLEDDVVGCWREGKQRSMATYMFFRFVSSTTFSGSSYQSM